MLSLVSYINLEFRDDRNSHMLNTLSACPYPYKKIAGIRLDQPPEKRGLKMIPRLEGAAGVAGIFMSHCRALEDAINSGVDGKFALLEDDVRINKEFWDLDVEEILLETDFDILFLSPRYKAKIPNIDGKKPFVPTPFGLRLVDMTSALNDYIITGAHFLVFRDRATIENTLRKLRNCDELMDVDLFYLLNANCCGIHLDCVGTASLGSNHKVEELEG